MSLSVLDREVPCPVVSDAQPLRAFEEALKAVLPRLHPTTYYAVRSRAEQMLQLEAAWRYRQAQRPDHVELGEPSVKLITSDRVLVAGELEAYAATQEQRSYSDGFAALHQTEQTMTEHMNLIQYAHDHLPEFETSVVRGYVSGVMARRQERLQFYRLMRHPMDLTWMECS